MVALQLQVCVHYHSGPISCKEIQLLKDNVYSHRLVHCDTESLSPPCLAHKHTHANTHEHKAAVMKEDVKLLQQSQRWSRREQMSPPRV